MKKLIAIAVVLALVAGAAFAADGISIQAWGRGAFVPLKYVTAPQDGNGNVVKDGAGEELEGEAYTGTGASWGGDKARVDFRITGATDYVGFSVNATAENNTLNGNDDAAKIWVKPFGNDALKLSVGQFVDDSIRGKIGNLDGGFSNFVLGKVYEEDAIFSRFTSDAGQGGAPHGYMISSAPVDGLFLGLAVNGAMDPDWNGTNGTAVANAFRYLQIGGGYNIANIGHIRIQYLGGWSGVVDPTDKDTAKYYQAGKRATIEAAFALTAVEGLLVDLGAKIHLPLELKDTSVVSDGADISLGATYNTGAIGIGARVDIKGLGAYNRSGSSYKDDKSESGAETVIRVVPTYALDAATLGLDIAFALKGKNKDSDGKDVDKSDGNQIGFGAFVSKGLPSGNIRAGLSYTLAPNNGDGKAVGSGIFQIPVILEYAFF